MLACAYPALDPPMILFQNVVEILHRSMPAILLQSLVGFEPHDGRWIAGVFVGVDDPRRRMLVRACKATRVAELARDGGGSARRPGARSGVSSEGLVHALDRHA